MFQRMIESSEEAEAKREPEGETATRLTQSVCCCRVSRQAPLRVSHSRIDGSREQESKKSACEGIHAKPETSCSCPVKVFCTVNVCRFQSLIVMSVAQEARTCPF